MEIADILFPYTVDESYIELKEEIPEINKPNETNVPSKQDRKSKLPYPRNKQIDSNEWQNRDTFPKKIDKVEEYSKESLFDIHVPVEATEAR